MPELPGGLVSEETVCYDMAYGRGAHAFHAVGAHRCTPRTDQQGMGHAGRAGGRIVLALARHPAEHAAGARGARASEELQPGPLSAGALSASSRAPRRWSDGWPPCRRNRAWSRPCESPPRIPAASRRRRAPMMWQPTIFSSGPTHTSFMSVRVLRVVERVIHRREIRDVHLHRIAEARARLALARAHRADGRMREHHGRNHVVVEMPLGLAAEQAVAEAPARRDRHGRERGAPGHVADRVDAGDIGVLERVGRHESARRRARRPPRSSSSPATFAERPIAHSTQSKSREFAPVGRDQRFLARLLAQRGRHDSRVDGHALPRASRASATCRASHRSESAGDPCGRTARPRCRARETRRRARRRRSRCRRPPRVAAAPRARRSRPR